MKVGLIIFGEPASKANQRQIVTFPTKATHCRECYTARPPGAKACVCGESFTRPSVIKSKKARDYERDALRQIPPAVRLRLEGPVRVTLRIFYASERPDLDESVVLDVLQDRFAGKGEQRVLVQKGVYRNDRQVREKHVFHGIDRANPRAEVTIEALEPQQVELAPPPEVKGIEVTVPVGMPF